MTNTHLQSIDSNGFSILPSLDAQTYSLIYSAISKQWLSVIERQYPSIYKRIIDSCVTLADYHTISPGLDHSSLWPKINRILPQGFATSFLSSDYFCFLRQNLGDFEVSDEESLGYPNFYWRLVRPHASDDVGPAHRDSWFWQLNPQYEPKFHYQRRLKVWVAVNTTVGQSGLLIAPQSHLDQSLTYIPEQRLSLIHI